MALTCDYCGKIIGEDEYVTVPFDFTHDKLGGTSADDWFYYCVDNCRTAVRGLLENQRRFGHEGDKAGLRWTLTEDPDAVVVTEAQPPPDHSSDGSCRFDGMRLRTLRKRRGFSQKGLGEQLDPEANQGDVSTWETGKRRPSQAHVDQLAALFGVPAAVLTTDGPDVSTMPLDDQRVHWLLSAAAEMERLAALIGDKPGLRNICEGFTEVASAFRKNIPEGASKPEGVGV